MRDDLEAGDIVSIPFGIGLRHYGVVTMRGTVLSSSRRHGGVVEQTLHDFGDGRRIKRHGAFSNRHEFEIEARARRYMGSDYHLTASNCVHYVRRIHDRKPTITQIGTATLQALGDMLRPRRR